MHCFVSYLKTIGYVFIIVYTCSAQAEYYLQCREFSPEVVSIKCKHNHCSWHTTQVSSWERARHRHPHYPRAMIANCNQDMATGDDNACRHPELEVD